MNSPLPEASTHDYTCLYEPILLNTKKICGGHDDRRRSPTVKTETYTMAAAMTTATTTTGTGNSGLQTRSSTRLRNKKNNNSYVVPPGTKMSLDSSKEAANSTTKMTEKNADADDADHQKNNKSESSTSTSTGSTTPSTREGSGRSSAVLPMDCCSLGLKRILPNDDDDDDGNGGKFQHKRKKQKLGPLIVLNQNMYLGRTPLKMMKNMKSFKSKDLNQWTFRKLQKFNRTKNRKFAKTQAPLGIDWEGTKGGCTGRGDGEQTKSASSSKALEQYVSRHLLQIINHFSNDENKNNDDDENNNNDDNFSLNENECSITLQ